MARKLFAILDLNGHVITATRGDLNDAVGEAASISGTPDAVLVDGTASAADELRPNAAAALRSEEGKLRLVVKSAERNGLPQISWRDIQSYPSIEDAYRELAHIFRGLHKVDEATGAKRHIKAYDTARGTAKALLGSNLKMSKKDPLAKLSRVPMFRGQNRDIKLQGLAMLPSQVFWGVKQDHKLVASLPNTCPHASPECRAACLVFSGQNEVDRYNSEAKRARMRALYEHPAAFMRLLTHEIRSRVDHGRRRGTENFFRLNVYSDLVWEMIVPDMFEQMSDVGWFDYSKIPGRNPPPNYDITFSFSGHNEADCLRELREGYFLGKPTGRRVAVVFLSAGETARRRGEPAVLEEKQKKMFWPLPRTFWGYPVVNGDFSDARMCDPPNAVTTDPCVVGLHYKLPMGLADRVEKGLESLGKFVVKMDDVRAGGRQTFAEYKKNANIVMPTVVVQAHEVDGCLVIAGTPVHEGANDWHEED